MTTIAYSNTENMEIRKSKPNEFIEIKKIYRKIGFQWSISRNDYTLVAKENNRIIGLVKVNEEYDCSIMRGLYVEESYRRQGVATKLIEMLESHLEGKETYCLPYANLKGFYKSFGYEVLAFSKAPEFLKRQLLFNNKPRKRLYNQRRLRIIMRKGNGGG